jgi:heptosyltransferase-1
MKMILLVKMSSLGDVVCNLPLVSDLRAHLPYCEIHWVVEENIVAIPAMHPGVDHVLPVAMRRWRKSLLRPRTWGEIHTFVRGLRSTRYDAVLDTQGLMKSLVVAKLAHGPDYGHDRRSAREPLAGRLYRHPLVVPRTLHAVARNRMVAADAFEYSLDTLPLDYGIAAPPVERFDWLPPDPYVYCLHGTARASKAWPAGRWFALLDRLGAAGVTPVLAWGSDREHALSREIAANTEGAVVPPLRLDISQTATAIHHARAVIGVDTGFLHLAAALAQPLVGIYTDTDPALSGALAATGAHAINVGNIGEVPTVEQVWQALQKVGGVDA